MFVMVKLHKGIRETAYSQIDIPCIPWVSLEALSPYRKEDLNMTQIAEIQPSELRHRIQAGEKLQMIDVREDEEVAQGMIDGAKHIPLGQIPDRLSEIDKSGEIIIICRSGYRSERACEYLQQLGYDGCTNMVGGMLEWQQEDE